MKSKWAIRILMIKLQILESLLELAKLSLNFKIAIYYFTHLCNKGIIFLILVMLKNVLNEYNSLDYQNISSLLLKL
jgi:hypothetical protein